MAANTSMNFAQFYKYDAFQCFNTGLALTNGLEVEKFTASVLRAIGC